MDNSFSFNPDGSGKVSYKVETKDISVESLGEYSGLDGKKITLRFDSPSQLRRQIDELPYPEYIKSSQIYYERKRMLFFDEYRFKYERRPNSGLTTQIIRSTGGKFASNPLIDEDRLLKMLDDVFVLNITVKLPGKPVKSEGGVIEKQSVTWSVKAREAAEGFSRSAVYRSFSIHHAAAFFMLLVLVIGVIAEIFTKMTGVRQR